MKPRMAASMSEFTAAMVAMMNILHSPSISNRPKRSKQRPDCYEYAENLRDWSEETKRRARNKAQSCPATPSNITHVNIDNRGNLGGFPLSKVTLFVCVVFDGTSAQKG